MKGVTRWKIKQQDVFLSPPELFAKFEELYGVKDLSTAFDPCPWPEAEVDGLTCDWEPITFCNPPFSKNGLWIKKALQEAQRGVVTYMVLPWYSFYGASTCTKLLTKPSNKLSARFTFYSPVLKRDTNIAVWLLRIDANTEIKKITAM